jgi:hypothetical protein
MHSTGGRRTCVAVPRALCAATFYCLMLISAAAAETLVLEVDGRVLASPTLREPIVGGAFQFDLAADTDLTAADVAERMLKPDAKVEVAVK